MRKVDGNRVTILGAARSGLAAARLLKRKGAEVFLSEKSSIPVSTRISLQKTGIEFESGGHSDRVLDADFCVLSPGVPSSVPPVVTSINKGIPVYSEIEIASWFTSQPLIAITGSNGKTTTTSLCGWIMEESKKKVYVAGNIGLPFSSVVESIEDEGAIGVLEISSFQLDHIDQFRPRVSVILNITPDHLDRYENDFDRYAQSKFRIAKNQGRGDTVILNTDDPILSRFGKDLIASSSANLLSISLEPSEVDGAFLDGESLKMSYHGLTSTLMNNSELALRGLHNTYNSLAAAMAARVVELDTESIRESLRSFPGLPHRLQEVREFQDVLYVNDSKATNVNAVWYALGSFDRPIVLIAGGRDKGNDYGMIKELVQDKVKALIAIGEGADTILEELAPFAEQALKLESMEDAVRAGQMLADSGDVVLLSPACSSFDMFENYEQRGKIFTELVDALEPRQPGLFETR